MRLVFSEHDEQKDNDADKFEGVVTIQAFNLSTGAAGCVGTYEITATRQ